MTSSSPPEPSDAALYAALHRGEPGDVAFYRQACTPAPLRVLELGAGYGRIAGPLARDGHDVVAVEVDPAMIALARDLAHGGTWVVADMRTFTADRRFDRVIIAHNTLLCLPPEEQAATLRRARALVADDGRLLLDVYRADDRDDWEQGDDAPEPLVALELDDRMYHVLESNHFHHGRLEVRYAFVPRGGGPTRTLSVVHHPRTVAELTEALADAGWALERVAGGFGGEDDDDDAPTWVATARPAPM